VRRLTAAKPPRDQPLCFSVRLRRCFQLAVIVTVGSVWVVQVPFYQIIQVVAMPHLFMSVVRSMNVRRWMRATLVVRRAAGRV
jgi:hypothetical protein